jgi:hypothetical protein
MIARTAPDLEMKYGNGRISLPVNADICNYGTLAVKRLERLALQDDLSEAPSITLFPYRVARKGRY